MKTSIQTENKGGNIAKEIIKQYLFATIAVIVGVNLVAFTISQFDDNLSPLDVKYNGIADR